MSRLGPGLALILFSVTAFAQSQYLTPPNNSGPAPAQLFGVWGDSAQCEAYPGQRTDNPASAAYEISRDWIKQGWFHCLINWRASWPTGNGLQAQAFAQCGEDLIREYRIVLILDSDTLQIRWTDDYSTSSLRRCTLPDPG